MSLSANPVSTGAPTLEWAHAVKRLELAALGPAEPLADALLEIEQLRSQLVNGITDAMVDRALNAWFRSPPSETNQGLERSMRAALEAAFIDE